MFEEILKLASLFVYSASSPEYMRQYMANRYHKVRNSIIEELGSKCKNCGSEEGPFHLDHIDASKKTFRAADAHSVSDGRLKAEMKNLQILCVPCHKKKTHDSWDYGVNKTEHGSYWMYRKYKCRCEECVAAYKEKRDKWRKKK